MTLAELADSLPNGFHDSALRSLSVDYEKRIARMDISLLVGQPDDPVGKRENYRDAVIELLALHYFVVSAPDSSNQLGSASEVWIVDGYNTDEVLSYCKEIDPTLLQSLPSDIFAFSFYVHDWNSYIHVAASDCRMGWSGGERAYMGRRQHLFPGETIDLS